MARRKRAAQWPAGQILCGFGVLILVVGALLWLFQIVLLEPFYRTVKTAEVKATAEVVQRHLDSEDLDEQVEQLVKVNPQVVFLTFGANDILATKGDEKAYIEQYKALIEKIRKKLPETKIFINSIFPVQKWRVEEEPLFEHIAKYNEALRAMCDKLQIAYVDNTELVTDRYYEDDGMHFKSDFYPVWARRMAEFAAL